MAVSWVWGCGHHQAPPLRTGRAGPAGSSPPSEPQEQVTPAGSEAASDPGRLTKAQEAALGGASLATEHARRAVPLSAVLLGLTASASVASPGHMMPPGPQLPGGSLRHRPPQPHLLPGQAGPGQRGPALPSGASALAAQDGPPGSKPSGQPRQLSEAASRGDPQGTRAVLCGLRDLGPLPPASLQGLQDAGYHVHPRPPARAPCRGSSGRGVRQPPMASSLEAELRGVSGRFPFPSFLKINFFSSFFLNLKDRRLSICTLPKCPQEPVLGQAKARSQGLHRASPWPSLEHGLHGPSRGREAACPLAESSQTPGQSWLVSMGSRWRPRPLLGSRTSRVPGQCLSGLQGSYRLGGAGGAVRALCAGGLLRGEGKLPGGNHLQARPGPPAVPWPQQQEAGAHLSACRVW